MVGLVFDLDDTLYDSRQFLFAGFEEICNRISMEKLKNFYDIDHDKVVDRFAKAIFRNIKPKLTLYDWVIPLLKSVDCPKGIITNGELAIQNYKIDALGIRDYFNYLIINNEPVTMKPHPYSLNIMRDTLNVDKCVYVGDRETDKEFAENANAYFINIKEDDFIERIKYCCTPR